MLKTSLCTPDYVEQLSKKIKVLTHYYPNNSHRSNFTLSTCTLYGTVAIFFYLFHPTVTFVTVFPRQNCYFLSITFLPVTLCPITLQHMQPQTASQILREYCHKSLCLMNIFIHPERPAAIYTVEPLLGTSRPTHQP